LFSAFGPTAWQAEHLPNTVLPASASPPACADGVCASAAAPRGAAAMRIVRTIDLAV
jgi:hypothetical protein